MLVHESAVFYANIIDTGQRVPWHLIWIYNVSQCSFKGMRGIGGGGGGGGSNLVHQCMSKLQGRLSIMMYRNYKYIYGLGRLKNMHFQIYLVSISKCNLH